MNTRSALFALVCALAVSAPAQTFSPVRKFSQGATDAYTMKMKMNSSMGEIALSLDMTQTIKKVYDNGDADIESAVANMTVNMAGNEMHPPAQPPTTIKVNKYGLPLTSMAKTSGMNFSRFGSYFGDKELKVGESYTFDQVDKDNPKNHVKGVAKLLSLEGGKAHLSVTVDSYMANADKPMHLDGTVTADAATGKMLKFEGKATDLPAGGQGPTIASAEFTMEHK